MMKLRLIGLFGLLTLVFGVVQSAQALPKFKNAFEKRYVEESTNEEFKALAKKESCNVCHVKGEKKDVRNNFGNALSKLIGGDAQQRLKDASDKAAEEEKILKQLEEAFVKVEVQKTDDKNPSSPTFGDLLKAGKLPIDE
jgi:hypothetical protein